MALLLAVILAFGGFTVGGHAVGTEGQPRLKSFQCTIGTSEGVTFLPNNTIVTGEPILHHYQAPLIIGRNITAGEIWIPVDSTPIDRQIGVHYPYESSSPKVDAPFEAVIDWGGYRGVATQLFFPLNRVATGNLSMTLLLSAPEVKILYDVRFFIAPLGFGQTENFNPEEWPEIKITQVSSSDSTKANVTNNADKVAFQQLWEKLSRESLSSAAAPPRQNFSEPFVDTSPRTYWDSVYSDFPIYLDSPENMDTNSVFPVYWDNP